MNKGSSLRCGRPAMRYRLPIVTPLNYPLLRGGNDRGALTEVVECFGAAPGRVVAHRMAAFIPPMNSPPPRILPNHQV